MGNYYIDVKYINLLSTRLQKFSWKKNNLAVCRCPICGDSTKSQIKTRFYFYQSKNAFFVKCHNCGYTSTFNKFLEHQDNFLHEEYKVEVFKDKFQEQTIAFPAPVFKKEVKVGFDIKSLQSIDQLAEDHPAKIYIKNRKIPEKYYSELYYTDNFKEVANQIDHPKDGEEVKYPKDHRIIIPLYSKDKQLFGIQGRALGYSSLRYITVKSSDHVKIYGLERLDVSRKIYCVEGPFDSLFLDNAIAISGASVDYKSLGLPLDKVVLVFDNEPRNEQILHIMERAIQQGFSICIWSEDIHQKDINDMVLAGLSPQSLIDTNTVKGLAAELKFNNWKKI